MGKKVARTQWSASTFSTAGVLPCQGPSSNVSTTSPARRKSCILKCSQPKPGPPVVSILTTRVTPSALGLAAQVAAGAVAWGGAAARVGAEPGAGVGAGRVCAQATPTVIETKTAHALATRIAGSPCIRRFIVGYTGLIEGTKLGQKSTNLPSRPAELAPILFSWLRSPRKPGGAAPLSRAPERECMRADIAWLIMTIGLAASTAAGAEDVKISVPNGACGIPPSRNSGSVPGS